MSDPLAPPPRRPMPEHLERRITDELTAVTARRRRIGSVVIPLVAAAVVGAIVVVGTTAFRDRLRVEPAETASPVATAMSTPAPRPTPSVSPTRTPAPKPVTVLDVRPMTKAEIAADTKSCWRREAPDDLVRPRGTPRTRYAMVQRRAEWSGAGSTNVRVLVIEDDASYWSCENGSQWEAAPGPISKRTTSTTTPPAVEVENYGGFSGQCSGPGEMVGSELFLVDREVAIGRVRLVGKDHRGPWQTTEPMDGVAAFPLRLAGDGVWQRSVGLEVEFLDRRGDRLPIQPYGQRGTPTTRTYRAEFPTCADMQSMRDRPKPVGRPSSDAAGIRTCQAMIKESADRTNVSAGRDWKSRLLISTREEWGTVLSDGRNLVGCSLYPTKEISPFIPDEPVLRKSAFSFAVNPIGFTGASSLWAAGRVPTDVSAIGYRLPGDQDVAATIDDQGYWMLKYHTAAEKDIGSQDRSSDWPPVQVTVTRPSGTTRYSIEFSEETMCRQVSHGC